MSLFKKKLIIFFLGFFISLSLSSFQDKALALVCTKDTSGYACLDRFDLERTKGCQIQSGDPCGCFDPSKPPPPSQTACYLCPSQQTWSCADPVCGSALSCPRSYTWETCGTNPGQCNTFTTTDSPSCQCQQTCSDAEGVCTSNDQCASGTSEIFGAVCSTANEICCTQPTPTPTPTPGTCTNQCTPGSAWCVSSTTYNTCDQQPNGCFAGGSVRSCPSGQTCNNGSCTPTPTPAPAGCEGAPKTSPPKNTPTSVPGLCNLNASSCTAPCSDTCTIQGRTCAATSCVSVWGCQGGTQWYNSGVYYPTCPTSCGGATPVCIPGQPGAVTCDSANACVLR